jgi:hypothetical protein
VPVRASFDRQKNDNRIMKNQGANAHCDVTKLTEYFAGNRSRRFKISNKAIKGHWTRPWGTSHLNIRFPNLASYSYLLHNHPSTGFRRYSPSKFGMNLLSPTCDRNRVVLTTSTEYKLPRSVSQISRSLWNLKVYLPCSKSPVLNHILSHLNPKNTP